MAIGSAARAWMERNRPPRPDYGGVIDWRQEQADVRGGARVNPAEGARQMMQYMQPQLMGQQQLMMPHFREALGAALGESFAKSGRSGGLNVAADRVSRSIADRMGLYQTQLASQAMGLGVQHAGQQMQDFRHGQQNLLDTRRFDFDRDAYQEELRLAQEAARQKRKGGVLGAVGGALGGLAGAALGPVGSAIGARIGSAIMPGR